MVDELDEYDEQQMDENFKKFQLWQQKKLMKAHQQQQAQSVADAFKSNAEEFGLSVEEYQKAFQQPATSEDHAKERAELQRRYEKAYNRAAFELEQEYARGKKGPGNPMQDARGRFTSPKKEATVREQRARIDELKEKIFRGKASDDEKLELTQLVVGRLY